ncbi:MAG: ABC transporter ATP-binding protein [Anaerolineales bacterium]
MAVVEVKGLRKRFHDVLAVDGVDLAIREGELLVILGPSGCGKTTLMRMIAGLEIPTEGDVFIGGERVTEYPPRERRIGMVFQSYALYPHMTVFENIAFPLRAQATWSKEEIVAKVEWAASILGIERLLGRKPRQLSGGERQRVALSRALVKEPRVLLLDEPLSNLDAKLRASARDELQRFQRRLGITTVFVTHDQIEAMGMGDRIAVMFAGKVRQIGSPLDIYHDSMDTFVATFLGSPGMNLVEGDRHLIGFRPEHFHPKASGDRSTAGQSFAFHATRVEYLGADRLVYGSVDHAARQTQVVAKLPSTVPAQIEAGQVYDFAVAAEYLRYFDKVTGQRIRAERDR